MSARVVMVFIETCLPGGDIQCFLQPCGQVTASYKNNLLL